jgi:hypothetical protein
MPVIQKFDVSTVAIDVAEFVTQAFQPAGSGDFPAASSGNRERRTASRKARATTERHP